MALRGPQASRHVTLDMAAPLVTVLAQARADNQTTYVYGLGDSPLASEDGGGTWRHLSGRDALNSVRQETDADGAGAGGAPLRPLRRAAGRGRRRAVWLHRASSGRDLGSLFLRARYLRSEFGVFLTATPGRGTCGSGYGYGGGNPLRHTAPAGHNPQCAVRVGGGPLGAGALVYEN